VCWFEIQYTFSLIYKHFFCFVFFFADGDKRDGPIIKPLRGIREAEEPSTEQGLKPMV
jgi:hypothetical protein